MPKRADILLTEQALAPSRERAKILIMEGVVFCGENKVMKPSDVYPDDAELSIKEDPVPFVSRGGLKLDKAVRKYGIDLNGRVCLDVGASTGGFTDCMLKNGAKRVYAVDVGYGQLDWKLRNNPRVTCMERHNARFMEASWFEETPSFATCDVSFISIRLILPRIHSCLSDTGTCVILVKPQFEAGKNKVGKNGVVRDAGTHCEVLTSAAEFAAECGFSVIALDYSPITGPKGNIEYLMYLSKDAAAEPADIPSSAKEVVELSHTELTK
ncbi:MAG: TlyA family RNA methyltransferase [Clostridia bacterium]|nr:TlyA family RNA methyltransferase [Clostridia bacterium]